MTKLAYAVDETEDLARLEEQAKRMRDEVEAKIRQRLDTFAKEMVKAESAHRRLLRRR